jgi:pimeloyl-ACP methyl ester carboxylesterase
MQPSRVHFAFLVAIAFAAGALAFCPRGVVAQPAAGKLEQIRVHGAALDGNLSGDDATRDVFVYLPPSYAREPNRRYPVVYFLHGYTATAQAYVKFVDLPQAADAAIAAGGREMIIVLPDAFTKWSGSMYSSSVTTGDWESYVAHDLVAYIDSHYRTIAKRESRGLSGHSMGGYGTWRIGMKRPDVFGALYAMSSCCLLIDPARGGDPVTRPRASGDTGATPPPHPSSSSSSSSADRPPASRTLFRLRQPRGRRIPTTRPTTSTYRPRTARSTRSSPASGSRTRRCCSSTSTCLASSATAQSRSTSATWIRSVRTT